MRKGGKREGKGGGRGGRRGERRRVRGGVNYMQVKREEGNEVKGEEEDGGRGG